MSCALFKRATWSISAASTNRSPHRRIATSSCGWRNARSSPAPPTCWRSATSTTGVQLSRNSGMLGGPTCSTGSGGPRSSRRAGRSPFGGGAPSSESFRRSRRSAGPSTAAGASRRPEPQPDGAPLAVVAARDRAGARDAHPGTARVWPPRQRAPRPAARPLRGAPPFLGARHQGAPVGRASQSGARSVRGPPAGTRPAASRSANASGSSGHFGRGIRVNGTAEKTSGGAT